MDNNNGHFENRMRSFSFRLSVNILLAIVIYLAAEVGKRTGIEGPALPVSLIWPATGISLAALLIFGFKVSPGIFIGNLLSNMTALIFINSESFIAPFLTAVIVSSGSYLQAIAGNVIIRTFSSERYFKTVSDVMIFLFPAGIFTCFIAPTIGMTALYSFYGNMNLHELIYAWITFWIGDTVGIFVGTPFLVVWTRKPDKPFVFVTLFWESVVIVLSLFAVLYLIFIEKIEILRLYIPICMWAAYRFRLHGATLAIVLLTTIQVVPTIFDIGPFDGGHFWNHLINLITFIETSVGVVLTFGALVEERDNAMEENL